MQLFSHVLGNTRYNCLTTASQLKDYECQSLLYLILFVFRHKNISLPQITSENMKVKRLETSLVQNRTAWRWTLNPYSRCGRDNEVSKQLSYYLKMF